MMVSGIIIAKAVFFLSAAVIVYVYGVYPAILLLIDRFHRGSTPAFSADCPSVSIIIAAYNEEKVIARKIENCLSLEYPKDKLEIIIASDGSDDGTADIVRRYENRGVRFFDYTQRRGKVNVLNETVPQAKGEIIVFSDANTIFAHAAIKKLVRHFGDKDIGAVCGALQFVNADGSKTADLEGFYWRFETFLKRIEGSHGSLLGANGAIYAIRKELFRPCPPDTIVEDFVIPMTILQRGYRVVYEPQAFATEEAAKHIIQEKHRRIRIGAGDFQALAMFKDMLLPRHGFSALAFWSHKALRWCVPFFLIGAFTGNLFLLPEPFFFLTFVAQCAFYLAAFGGRMLHLTGMNFKILNLCYYFVSMNLALLLGFFRFITRRQKVAWDRTER